MLSFDAPLRIRHFQVNVVENTKNITLHAKNLNITRDDITLSSLPYRGDRIDKKVSINRTEFQEDFDFFVIHTNDVLQQGNQYELFIPFKSDLSKGLLGYYRSSYNDKESNSKR